MRANFIFLVYFEAETDWMTEDNGSELSVSAEGIRRSYVVLFIIAIGCCVMDYDMKRKKALQKFVIEHLSLQGKKGQR